MFALELERTALRVASLKRCNIGLLLPSCDRQTDGQTAKQVIGATLTGPSQRWREDGGQGLEDPSFGMSLDLHEILLDRSPEGWRMRLGEMLFRNT